MSPLNDNKVLALCDEIWNWRLRESPELSTFCGLYHYEESWDDISSEAYHRREHCLKAFLEQALSLDVQACSKDVTLSHMLLVEDMKMYLQACTFPCHLMPINYLEGAHVDCCRTISFMKFDGEDDFAKYIQRLNAMPKKIHQTIELLKEGVSEGVVLFISSIQNIPKQIESMVNPNDVDESGLMKPFTEDHPNIEADTLESFHRQARSVIVTSIFPELVELKNYLEREGLRKYHIQENNQVMLENHFNGESQLKDIPWIGQT
ncbi:hypothetical protein PoB_003804400 [Plakobranchus ocellatus]|uniref:Uncharacterized protein n=1 Tax=Plakobranchus ocellatus TaxID=259542 RepID=A0AAV4AUS2_9GAST|nr:hypothetical protein PoB_003804400 [Plakobranchus ocellatus]